VSTPDFDLLRAQRNKAEADWLEKMKADGWTALRPSDPDACYCDCGNGGPCEHKWDGEPYESADDGLWSATCSRCGMTAFSHDLRNAP